MKYHVPAITKEHRDENSLIIHKINEFKHYGIDPYQWASMNLDRTSLNELIVAGIIQEVYDD